MGATLLRYCQQRVPELPILIFPISATALHAQRYQKTAPECKKKLPEHAIHNASSADCSHFHIQLHQLTLLATISMGDM